MPGKESGTARKLLSSWKSLYLGTQELLLLPRKGAPLLSLQMETRSCSREGQVQIGERLEPQFERRQEHFHSCWIIPWGGTYLSTNVRITASVSSTSPSTFCFFLLGSWGPRPLLGGRTGSLGWLLASGMCVLLCSVCRPWEVPLSSAPLSSRQTHEFPMLPAPKAPRKWGMWCSRVNSRAWKRLLLA